MKVHSLLSGPKFRYLVATAVIVLVSALAVTQCLVTKESADRRVGIILDFKDDKVVISEVIPGLPADTAGIQSGDQLLTMDGNSILKEDDYDLVAQHFQRGQAVLFKMQRDDGTVTLEVRPGTPFPWLVYLLNLFIVLIYLGIGLLAFLQRPPDLRKNLLFLFTTAIAIEFALPLNVIGSPTVILLTGLMFSLMTGFQFSVELHLAASIPDRHPWVERFPWTIKLFYLFGLGIGFLLASTDLAAGLEWNLYPWFLDLVVFLNDVILFPFWVGGLVILLGFQALRHPRPLGRQQAGLVLLGILPWTVMVIYTTILFAVNQATPHWADVAWALVLFPFPVAVFIGMFRYNLFDIKLVVRRGLMYSSLTGTLLLCFYAFLGVGSFLLSQFVVKAEPSIWLIAGSALLLGLLFQSFRRFFQQKIDAHFFPERHAFRQQLTSLAGELPGLGKMPRMGDYLVKQLKEVFNLKSAVILLADDKAGILYLLASSHPDASNGLEEEFFVSLEDPGIQHLRRMKKSISCHRIQSNDSALKKYLTIYDVDRLVPLFAHQKLSGVLLVGQKVTGEKFKAEEIEMLNFLAQHVAVVFENAKLFTSATYDGLTGIFRREAILEKLEQEMKRACRYGRPLTVGIADLDNFKSVNDQHGHQVGDITLKRVTQVMLDALRGADFIGRYGGEEFLFVFPESDLKNANEGAERIRKRVENMSNLTPGGRKIHLTVSIGLATLEAECDTGSVNIEQLIGNADHALLEAKRLGRNRVKVFQ